MSRSSTILVDGEEYPDPTSIEFPEFAKTYLHITPKSGGVIPFALNRPQLRLWNLIQDVRAKGEPVRIIILKARQMGFSTMSLGMMYQYATIRVGVMTFLAAHDDDSTRDLFDRVRLMYDLAPAKPMTRYSNKTELDFSNPKREMSRSDPGLQSKIRIGTAGKARLGRSKTLRYLHLSEVAFWDNAKRVLLGLEQALPDDPDTVEIIESTANGVGGEFYDRWKRVELGEEAGSWRGIFFAWHDFEEYRRPLRDDGTMEPVPTCAVSEEEFRAEERELAALCDLDQEQLNWRRWAIVSKCGNSLDLFKQEYPSTPQEAFLTSGRPIFNRALIQARVRVLQTEDLRRRAEERAPRFFRGRLVREKGRIRFAADPEGPLSIYSLPKKNHQYIIGADSCRGVSSGEDPDYAEAHVYDRFTWEQVAVFRERIEATAFEKVLLDLGYFYGSALIVPESNDHGHTVCVKLQEDNYPNVYIRQDVDAIGNVPVKKVGWETNTKTRPVLVDAVDGSINNRYAIFNDLPTLEQCLTFVRNPKTGKPEADQGCHDDGVFASALALAVLAHGPKPYPEASDLDLDRLAPEKRMVSRDIRLRIAERQQRDALRVATDPDLYSMGDS